jgi:hypothetical protein
MSDEKKTDDRGQSRLPWPSVLPAPGSRLPAPRSPLPAPCSVLRAPCSTIDIADLFWAKFVRTEGDDGLRRKVLPHA